MILAVLLALVLLTYFFGAAAARAAGHWLNVGQQPTRCKYVYVLGGELQYRPLVGAALLRAGLAERALLPRNEAPPPAAGQVWPAPHETVLATIAGRGVDEDRIELLPQICKSTIDEAQALKTRLADEPEARVAVVTSDYHTRRTRWTFERVFGDQAQRLHFVAAPSPQFTADNWWRTEQGFLYYSMEFIKIAYYHVRYGWAGWAAAALILAAAAVWIWRRRFGADASTKRQVEATPAE